LVAQRITYLVVASTPRGKGHFWGEGVILEHASSSNTILLAVDILHLICKGGSSDAASGYEYCVNLFILLMSKVLTVPSAAKLRDVVIGSCLMFFAQHHCTCSPTCKPA